MAISGVNDNEARDELEDDVADEEGGANGNGLRFTPCFAWALRRGCGTELDDEELDDDEDDDDDANAFLPGRLPTAFETLPCGVDRAEESRLWRGEAFFPAPLREAFFLTVRDCIGVGGVVVVVVVVVVEEEDEEEAADAGWALFSGSGEKPNSVGPVR